MWNIYSCTTVRKAFIFFNNGAPCDRKVYDRHSYPGGYDWILEAFLRKKRLGLMPKRLKILSYQSKSQFSKNDVLPYARPNFTITKWKCRPILLKFTMEDTTDN